MSTLSEFLTATEAAEVLKLSPVRVRQFLRKGLLGRKIGDRYVVAKDELRQFAKIPRRPGRPRKPQP